MFTKKHLDIDIEGQKQEANPTSSHQLEPLDLSKTTSFRYSLPINEESQGRQFDLEEREEEPVTRLTTQDTDTKDNDQEQEEILNTESTDSTYLSSSRCILNKEDPALYDSKPCRKGLPDIKSRTLLPQADHCEKRSFQNRDLVTNQENHECYDPRTQEASLASSTTQTTFSAAEIDSPSVEFDDQQRSNAYSWLDGFSNINLADKNEIRPGSSARDKQYNNPAVESKAEYPFKCKHCPKQFGLMQSLLNHALVHGAQANFTCNFCSKGFMEKKLLKRHLKVHKNNLDAKFPFKCDKCSKQYSRKINLEQHKLDHGAQPKFTCDFCSKGFMASSMLRMHSKVHKNNVDANSNSNP